VTDYSDFDIDMASSILKSFKYRLNLDQMNFNSSSVIFNLSLNKSQGKALYFILPKTSFYINA